MHLAPAQRYGAPADRLRQARPRGDRVVLLGDEPAVVSQPDRLEPGGRRGSQGTKLTLELDAFRSFAGAVRVAPRPQIHPAHDADRRCLSDSVSLSWIPLLHCHFLLSHAQTPPRAGTVRYPS